ncbi:HTH domain-containing protein [Selenomonas noxia]|uniref:HTH domain-containing protein n=1 Tax=Selenomonas noxia TaxID=135083 RepID=UPI00248C8677|nr:HTH domain-containing protein [Selenomonas noxia]
MLIDNPKITMAKMAERLNVAKRTIEREVKQLRETGRVERVGSKRFGHWKIND